MEAKNPAKTTNALAKWRQGTRDEYMLPTVLQRVKEPSKVPFQNFRSLGGNVIAANMDNNIPRVGTLRQEAGDPAQDVSHHNTRK